ncbi:hypothetical protein JHK86_055612 [Glycine max]|nr:hypothetical protein JHK86_055612 [Glycine max]
MAGTDTLKQLQNRITKIERRHKEELRKLKDDHDHLEARGHEQSSHTLPERTQGGSHPRCIGNNANDLSPSYMHRQAIRIVRRHPFVDRIMVADIPLGWKPLNLERYDGTTDPDEHQDAFLTQVNLYTNDDSILCHLFPTSLKGATLTWYGGLPPRSIDGFNTHVKQFNA